MPNYPVIDRGDAFSGGTDSVLAFLPPEWVQMLTPEAVELLSGVPVSLLFQEQRPGFAGQYHPPSLLNKKRIELMRPLKDGEVSPTFAPKAVTHESLHALDPRIAFGLLATPSGGEPINDPNWQQFLSETYSQDISNKPLELFAELGSALNPYQIPEKYQHLYSDIYKPSAFVPPPTPPTSNFWKYFIGAASSSLVPSGPILKLKKDRTVYERRHPSPLAVVGPPPPPKPRSVFFK